MPDLIELKNVYKLYSTNAGAVRALDGVTFSVKAGEFIAVIGSSGSGKSTLMNVIGCLDPPSAGTYRLNGTDVCCLRASGRARLRRECIGFVFQGFHLIPTLSALENVELPLSYRGMPKEERHARAKEALARVGLEKRLFHRPAELSGGQQQRVAIARAIAAAPPLILADEPTGNLDTRSGGEVMALLRGLHKEGHTVLLITHDPAIAAAAPRRVKLCDGRLMTD